MHYTDTMDTMHMKSLHIQVCPFVSLVPSVSFVFTQSL
jgi:hypothetical protein